MRARPVRIELDRFAAARRSAASALRARSARARARSGTPDRRDRAWSGPSGCRGCARTRCALKYCAAMKCFSRSVTRSRSTVRASISGRPSPCRRRRHVVVGELQVRHREVRIELQRREQRRFDRIDIPHRARLDRLGVLPQRLERSGRHFLERLRRRQDRVHRLAEVLAETPRELVDAREELFGLLVFGRPDEQQAAAARLDDADPDLRDVPAAASRSRK